MLPATLYPEVLGLNRPYFDDFTPANVVPEVLPDMLPAMFEPNSA